MTDRPTNQQIVRRTDRVIGKFHFQQEAVKDELFLTEAVPDVPPPSGQDNLSRTTGSLKIYIYTGCPKNPCLATCYMFHKLIRQSLKLDSKEAK